MIERESMRGYMWMFVREREKNECMVAACVKGRAYMLSMYVHVFVSLV